MGKKKNANVIVEATNVENEVLTAEVAAEVEAAFESVESTIGEVEIVAADEDAELISAVEEIVAKEEKRGRKINPTSERQIRLATKAALVEAGVKVERGRKVDPNSERQKRLNAFAAKWGDKEIKRGRPKMEKPAVVTEPEEPKVEETK